MRNDNIKVVVVDDVVDVADTLAMQLKLDGYSVYTAYSVEAAILEIEQHHPHCVLLDIGMPGMDGYQLATMLRHRYKHEITLIAVTGSDETQARVLDTFSVVDHYLRKPVDARTLGRLLSALGQTAHRQ